MKRFFLLPVFLLACAGQEPKPDPTEYFRLRAGAWWTYTVDRGSDLDTSDWTLDSVMETYHETLTITEENAGLYTWVITYDNDTIEDTMQAFVKADTLMLAFTKTFILLVDTVTVSDTVPYAPCPLEEGLTWTSPEKIVAIADLNGDTFDDTVYYSLNGTVEKTENLVLPAGQFPALRVFYKHTLRLILGNDGTFLFPLEQRIWWSPNNGPVRWVDRDYRNAPDPLAPPYLVKNLSDMGDLY